MNIPNIDTYLTPIVSYISELHRLKKDHRLKYRNK